MDTFNKSQIRETYQSARNSLEYVFVKEKSIKIFEMLTESKLLENKNSIFIYCSFNNEVDTYSIIDNLLDCGKKVIVPYMFRDCDGLMTMQLRELKCIKELVKGPMGIPQPLMQAQKPTQTQTQAQTQAQTQQCTNKIDVAIIPGVAFDVKRNRIGYGKGYYDKVLPFLNNECLKIALAFEMQIVPGIIDNEKHDIEMDYIITENRIIS